MRKTSSGFTLIELIIVITVIAILAAVALPRFVDFPPKAREAKAQGLYGAIRSASALAHAACLTNVGGACTPTAGTVDMEGALVAMVNRYPAGNVSLVSGAGGILLAAQMSPATEDVTVGEAAGTVTVDINGGTAGSCTVTYTQAAANQAPTIGINTSGC